MNRATGSAASTSRSAPHAIATANPCTTAGYSRATGSIRIHRPLLDVSAEVMQTILMRAADRDEARTSVETRIATLPTALFRDELFLARILPSGGTPAEIVDDVILPLVRP